MNNIIRNNICLINRTILNSNLYCCSYLKQKKSIFNIETSSSSSISTTSKYILLNNKNSSSSNNNTNRKEKEMDQIKSNPYFEKYKDKIKNVYENDPAEFEEKIKSLRKDEIKSLNDDCNKDEKQNYSYTKERKLDTIMKVEMLQDLSKDDIKQIWTSYHEQRSRISDTLNVDDYEIIEKRSKEFSTFVYPLPRANQGYEFVLGQWLNNECHFTPLINYQAYGENAPSIMTLLFFKDLAQTKDTVLVMSELDDKNCTIKEANFLYNQLKLYYLKSTDDDAKHKLLNIFHKTPQEFKHMDLIKQLEIDNLTKLD